MQLSISPDAVREHYDSMARVYRLFWGEHLHHGFFVTGKERPRQAQEQMLDYCARKVNVIHGSTVLDVGCGYGGTAIYLSRQYQAQVTGITISPRQAEIARKNARRNRVADRVSFTVADAERWGLERASCDLVWTMESSEHFADKAGYFRRAADALWPGGKLLLAAWTGSMRQPAIARLAEAAVCSSLQTAGEYTRQIEAAGMQVIFLEDVSSSVVKTWEICRRRARAALWLTPLRPLFPHSAREFVGVIDLMLDTFSSGLLSYTVLVAEKSCR